MNGITDYIASMLGLTIPVHIDVRLKGKSAGFDYTTNVWSTNNDVVSIEALCAEVAENAKTIYNLDLHVESLYVYVEKPNDGHDVLKLERIEEVSTIPANAKIRVQEWSDFVCESGRSGVPTLQRMIISSRNKTGDESAPPSDTSAETTESNRNLGNNKDSAIVSAVSGFTFRAYAGPLVDEAEGERLMDLLHQYGVHYKNIFGPDMTWRLLHGNNNNQSGLRGWSAWCVAPTESQNGAAVPLHVDFLRKVCVSNCSVIYNEVQKTKDVRVGLFGMVITAPRYRRRGVSTSLVSRVLRDWDVHCPKGWLVLGTGSPHAAQLYANNGFVHCNGGLDQATKGYNPDDVGEWIMIRPPCGSGSSSSSSSSGSSSSPSGFDREQFILDFYCHEEQEELFELVQLDRCYWAELCLLFNLDVEDANKLKSQGISTGVQVEEQMLKMINEKCPRNFVCLDRAMGRVHGVASFDAVTGSYDCYALPGMDTVRKMLENLPTCTHISGLV